MLSLEMHAGGSKPAIVRKLLVWSCIALAGAPLSSSAFAKRHVKLPVATAHAATYSNANRPDPEILLLDVYKELGANHLSEAQKKADTLVEAYPTFRLGQLIRGDLLQLHTKPISSFGAAPNAPKDKLENLREEAVVRLKSLMEKPDPNLVPHTVLQLRDDQKYVLLVDAKRSRLYVYTNQHGQLKYLSDYYVSQGKLGVHKSREGDQRTPIGVYYVTQRVPGAKLPDFYGAGALPINFPNEWDKINGRSGSGIWLHGTPSDTYSRPPLSSDGCVVLTNPDLHKLYESVEVGKTPVVISEKVDFVTKTKWESDRALANKIVDGWRHDIETRDASRVVANYSRQFKSEHGDTLGSLYDKYQRIFSGVKEITVSLKDSTFFFYPGRDDLIISTFTQESMIGKLKSVVRKRQYWQKEGSQWKIVSESYF